MAAYGLTDLSRVRAIRHAIGGDDGLPAADLNPAGVFAYTRRQGFQRGHPLGQTPEPLWLVFIAAGGSRTRFFCAYENHGEVAAERDDRWRYFDLRPSDLMRDLQHRLVVDWSAARAWAFLGATAARCPVVEIADPEVLNFPGYENVVLTYDQLQLLAADHRYVKWRTALAEVQGIYVIADSSSGRLYVDKADGSERVLCRWRQYAQNGHGGNVELKELLRRDPAHARHFVYSLLRVFSPSALMTEVNRAEEHYKRALLTVRLSLNR
ncbi:GIY-YIG nuclease family protein [Jatrophihabitans sp.]|uniref:GIY-YIG nuclease family protein n=1 Tax=Jatrophihabitans sp. TaxID=1932789 RepID=UPI003F7EB65D